MARVTDEQIERYLLLLRNGLKRAVAAQMVGEMPETFRILQYEDTDFRARMIEALEQGKIASRVDRASALSEERREHLLDLIRGGMTALEAGIELDIHIGGLNRGILNPLSVQYDREFHMQFKEAVETGRPNFVTRLRQMAITQAENGEYRALRDLLIVYDREFREAHAAKKLEVSADQRSFRMALLEEIDRTKLTENDLALLEEILTRGQPDDPPDGVPALPPAGAFELIEGGGEG